MDRIDLVKFQKAVPFNESASKKCHCGKDAFIIDEHTDPKTGATVSVLLCVAHAKERHLHLK